MRNRRRVPGYIANRVEALAYFEELVMRSGRAHLRSHDTLLRGRWAEKICFTVISKSESPYNIWPILNPSSPLGPSNGDIGLRPLATEETYLTLVTLPYEYLTLPYTCTLGAYCLPRYGRQIVLGLESKFNVFLYLTATDLHCHSLR